MEPPRLETLTEAYFLSCSAARAFVRGDRAWFDRAGLASGALSTGEVAQAAISNLRMLSLTTASTLAKKASAALGDIAFTNFAAQCGFSEARHSPANVAFIVPAVYVDEPQPA